MKSTIRRLAVTVAAIAAAGLSGAADKPATPPAPAPLALPDNLFAQPAVAVAPTTVVAVVEGKALTQGEVDEQVDRAMRANRGRIPPERAGEIRTQLGMRAREEMIIQMVLEHEADARKVTVKPEEIEKARASIPLPPGQTLDQALAAQGVTMARLDADLMRALKIKAMLDAAVPKAKITDAAVKEFFDGNPDNFRVPEQATARHILIRVPTGADDKAKAEKKALADDVRKKLVDGGDFAALCKQFSEDPGSKDNGGSYTFPRGQMVKPFEDAAFTQKIDEIGQPVETQFGYHIIQTTKREEARTVGFDEAAPRIRTMLENRSQGQAVQEFVRGLREKAKITMPGAAGT